MNDAPDSLSSCSSRTLSQLRETREHFSQRLELTETGTVTSVTTGIAKVVGLPGIGFEEIVEFSGGGFGVAFNVDANEVGVALLTDYSRLKAGSEALRSGRVMDVAVGEGLLGRVVDPLASPLDGLGPVNRVRRMPIERPAAAIMTAHR